MKENVRGRYRLSDDDAHDLVRDAMIAVCVRHSTHPYANLGAALQRAADNRARDDWRRNARYPRCPAADVLPLLPSCDASPDETVRFDKELEVVTAALCKEDRLSDRIIRQRIMDDVDFATIASELGISERDARDYYSNAMNRVKKRVAAACPG